MSRSAVLEFPNLLAFMTLMSYFEACHDMYARSTVEIEGMLLSVNGAIYAQIIVDIKLILKLVMTNSHGGPSCCNVT
jgi:hypothetical protein